VAALFSRSRAFSLSAFARLTGDSAFFGGGIDFLLRKTQGHVLNNNKNQRYIPRHIEGLQGHPGGPNGPAAVLQDTRSGITWKYAVSQNPAVLDQIFCRTPYAWKEKAAAPGGRQVVAGGSRWSLGRGLLATGYWPAPRLYWLLEAAGGKWEWVYAWPIPFPIRANKPIPFIGDV
jgi:hypothetical protein